jgi:cold shock CspA family protein
MTVGRITRLVRSFGSGWGLIRPAGDLREVFFNGASLVHPDDFARIEKEQEVEFEEQIDQVNGTRAVRVTLLARGRYWPLGNIGDRQTDG